MSEIVTQTAPPRLWICVSDEPTDNAAPFPKDLSEVTWAIDHCPVACGVGYIRSDLHNAELAALRETVRVLGDEHYESELAQLREQHGRQLKTIAELQAQLHAARWRKVEEELPIDGAHVIVFGPHTFPRVAYRGGTTWFIDRNTTLAPITHWHLLPTPPGVER